jgi:hypothetical protein
MKKKTPEIIIGYKGFDKDFKCKDLQYEVGATFTHNGDIKLCNSGLHFVENPFDILNYYPLIGSKFAVVEASEISDETESDSKRVAKSLTIKSELNLDGLIKAGWKFIFEKVSKPSNNNSATSGNGAHSATSGDGAHSATSGNYAHSATSGYGAHSATSGNRANSATSGYGAHSATSGINNAIACSVGRKAKAKASKGCFIVLAEWYEGSEWTDAHPIAVKSAKVDGKKIKADQWYKLVKGKFIETDDSNE